MGRHIGKILKNARLEKSLTQKQVTQRVGKKGVILDIESEDYNNIKTTNPYRTSRKGNWRKCKY